MQPFDKFRNDVLTILSKSDIPKDRIEAILEVPPQPEMGDLSLPCFKLAAELQKEPKKIADELAINTNASGLVKEIRIAGPYLNFYADWNKLGQLLIEEILKQKDSYGSGKNTSKFMVEFSHPNTHKAFHIGHMRNISIGESLSRILVFSGSKVVRANYQGDIGPHVAKCIWGFINLYKSKEPKKDRGRWLGDVYAEASKKMTTDEKIEKEVTEINKKIYAGDKELAVIWKKTRQWSLDYFESIYNDFGAKFDRFYFEAEVEKNALKISEQLLNKKVAKLSDGAIIMDLEKYGLSVWPLVTGNKTPLYSAKDLALAELQIKEYNPDKIIHVVGSEQNLHFRQLIKTLEMTKPKIAEKEYHLSYGLVNLPEGKMKSREGKVILYEDLKSEIFKLTNKITKKNNPKLGKAQLEKLSMDIALGALKYSMISQSPDKVIIFDWERALDFRGNSAPYIQYTYARANSIFRKAKASSVPKYDASLLKDPKERVLLKTMMEFPRIVSDSARDYRPHYVANYAYKLATIFNEFYEAVPVLVDDKDQKNSRLALIGTFQVVMKNALFLLGIEAPEKM
ncbi:MAG: arginine--tRNA ligase [Candidatus Aenigmarchaeota archaeon]|nr:arginine--tRNA ligase [Candidatus Aenigmarchaeota archaeon]